MNIFSKNKKYAKYHYATEAEFETEIVINSKIFFGDKTIYIDAKKKIDSKALGGTIPDGFFFDLSDKNDPQFYLVEVELASHIFFGHIFPQITKFFAFYKNHQQQKTLVEKLFSLIEADLSIKNEFKKYIGSKEIYKFLSDLIDNSQNILLIIDGEKKELPEILDTYTDTWGRMVKLLIIKKYVDSDNVIYTMDPEYEALEYISEGISDTPTEISEEFHMEGVQQIVKDMYVKIKQTALGIDSQLVFNPQKYYISIKSNKNICFIKVRKKKIRLIAMLPEEDVNNIVTHHLIKSLSDSVQGFYNGPCAAIEIENLDNFDEIEEIIRQANNIVKTSE